MALINIGLLNNGTTTIDSSNAGTSADTISLGLVSNGTVIVDGVDVTISNIVGGGILSNTVVQAINGANVTFTGGLAG